MECVFDIVKGWVMLCQLLFEFFRQTTREVPDRSVLVAGTQCGVYPFLFRSHCSGRSEVIDSKDETLLSDIVLDALSDYRLSCCDFSPDLLVAPLQVSLSDQVVVFFGLVCTLTLNVKDVDVAI